MNNEDKKYAVDIDKIGVDWDKQRSLIYEKVSRLTEKPSFLTWKKIAATTVVAVLIAGITIFANIFRQDEGDYYTAYVFSEEIDNYEIPQSFYVLNGYSEPADYSELVNYMIGLNGEKEEL